MPTNIFTNIEIDGVNYSIKKFTAKVGLKMARFVLAKMTPILPLLSSDANTEDRLFSALSEILDSMSDADIDDLVDKCLRVCYVNLPAGLQAIIDETGHYGVDDIEYDMMLTLRLCFEAIKWGASDFFGEKGSALKSLIGQLGSLQNQ